MDGWERYPEQAESPWLPSVGVITMSDKSPRQSLSKKSGKSLKQKRADKKTKEGAQGVPEVVNPHAKKR